MNRDKAEQLAQEAESIGWEGWIDPAEGADWVLVIVDPATGDPQITLHNPHEFDLWRAEQVSRRVA